MPTFPFSHKKLLEILDYNPLTGILRWKIANSVRVKTGDIAGYKTKEGYITVRINNEAYKAHRLAWFHYYGYMPENEIDHWDQVKHHNWILNLRQASSQCQKRNTGNPITNTSEVKGVTFDKNASKWKANITLDNKPKYLGIYVDFDDAVCARLAGEQCLNWSNCDSTSPAYLYVKSNIQGGKN